ncbi:MAG: hypothetical protein ABJF11_03740 [Reichenbachiella sp.]|uniref:hypothetical protein n=1 Tax=Reichenbachiella sp. TaxID=2184521 RepID=UPI0032651AF3
MTFSARKPFLPLSIYLLLNFFSPVSYAQEGVGIGTESVNTDAVLEIESTTKGLLIPRMTTAQRNALGASSTGLIVYDTTRDALYYYDGSSWLRLVVQPAQVNLDLNSHKIINLSNGTNSGDAVNKGQLDTKLNLSGGTMSGAINMSSNKVTNVSNGTNAGDAINKSQYDLKANKTQATWTNFTSFANGWRSDNNFPVQYYKDDFGTVHWRGHLRVADATSSVISTNGSISDNLAPPPDLSGVGSSSYRYVVAGYDSGIIAVQITVQVTTSTGVGRLTMLVDEYDALVKSASGYIDLIGISYGTRDY